MSQGVDLSSYPSWSVPSKTYRDLFNWISKELDTGITYVKDVNKGSTNYPDVYLGEISVSKEKLGFYGIQSTSPTQSTQKLDEQISKIIDIIEIRRFRVAKATYDQLTVKKSESLDRMSQLNSAEKIWVERVSSRLVHESLTIYGKQAHHRFEIMDYWMRTKGDLYSRTHYKRMRSLKFPKLDERSLEELKFPKQSEFASPMPWFPVPPSYSAMWPHDLSKDELEYINKTYDLEDPIRQTYTVVERVDSEKAQGIRTNPMKNGIGEQVEWVRTGLYGRLYRVVNIVFHKRFRRHFMTMAMALRENADISFNDTALDPQFKAYTLTMADTFENGDFYSLLKADLEQTQGNLFMSAFPHEGYWKDGTKFPFMLEVAIRDARVTASVLQNADVFQWLETETAKEIQELGIDYSPRLMKPEDIQKSAALAWAVAYGGFMRAYERDPGGHDYPKRVYTGITGHRTALFLDALKSWVPIMNAIGKQIINPEDAQYISFDGLVDFATWHEGSHGTGNRETTPTKSGRTMSEVLGGLWGLQAETYADAGAFVILDRLYRTGRISERKYREGVMSGIAMEFKRAWPKKQALHAAYQEGDPHGVGSNLMLGWLYEDKVLELKDDGQMYVDWKRLEPSVNALRSKLIEFASTDNLDDFKAWCNGRIKAIPDNLEERIVKAKKSVSLLVVLDRGFGLVPEKGELTD